MPSQAYIPGNANRVNWIRGFLDHVSVQAHPEKMSLEDKIERLQRRLGGGPVRFEEQMSKVVESKAKAEEERLMVEY